MSATLDSLRRRTTLGQHMTDHEEHVASAPVMERLATQHARNEAARPERARRTSFDIPAQDNQKGLVHYLLKQLRTHNPEVYATAAPWCERALPNISKGAISDVIDRLRAHLAAPANTTAVVTPEPRPAYDPYDDIPSGYYAVSNNDGHTSFYRVVHKLGRVYVDLQVSDSFNRIPWAVRQAALNKIREDGFEAAGRRYAAELGRCYRCGRTLTDEVSRELGIGPTCRNK